MDLFTTPPETLLAAALSACGIYLCVIVLTRLYGLRSYSKLTSYDFAITIAVGSVIASTVMIANTPLAHGIVAVATLFALQFVFASLRRRSDRFRSLVDNQPVLLMVGEEVIEENLRKVQLTRSELRAKLREANVITPKQVRAVVMETTGDVSVLHAGPDGPALDPSLLQGVQGVDRLRQAGPLYPNDE